MTGQLKEVFGIYANDRWQQGVGKPFIVVMTETDRAAMREAAKLDIEKIAQAAGVEMLKTARIAVRRGMRQQQQKGLKRQKRTYIHRRELRQGMQTLCATLILFLKMN